MEMTTNEIVSEWNRLIKNHKTIPYEVLEKFNRKVWIAKEDKK